MADDGEHAGRGDPSPGSGGAVVELAPGVTAPRAAVEVTAANASGPGGQHVNKRQTKVILRVALDAMTLSGAQRDRLREIAGGLVTGSGDVVISSDASRSQVRNKDACYERLRGMLIEATKPVKKRKKLRVPAWVKRRRLEEKKRRSETKRRRKGPEY